MSVFINFQLQNTNLVSVLNKILVAMSDSHRIDKFRELCLQITYRICWHKIYIIYIKNQKMIVFLPKAFKLFWFPNFWLWARRREKKSRYSYNERFLAVCKKKWKIKKICLKKVFKNAVKIKFCKYCILFSIYLKH